MLFLLGHLVMIPMVGLAKWGLLVVSYVTIQFINALFFHRGLAISARIVDDYMERYQSTMTPEDVHELFDWAHASTFGRYSLYSPTDGIMVWWRNRRAWRRQAWRD